MFGVNFLSGLHAWKALSKFGISLSDMSDMAVSSFPSELSLCGFRFQMSHLRKNAYHYENMPMQYTEIFKALKI